MPHSTLNRAAWLRGAALAGIAAVAGARSIARAGSPADERWRKALTPEQYHILREGGTEAPNSSALLNEHRAGTYDCVACNLALFSSKTKYDAGEGWPSFWQPLPGALKSHADYELIDERTEVHCARCGGHLGHVFNDGPKPTGLRYCIDGVALKFIPA
ncbi:MAG: peptide-methionine (R)-S-oxide reductase MsrB [Candidatus Baltobacteraceae bacterium]